MQQIERYGVIALVFFLITIVAVSFWGDSKSPGFWSRLTGRAKKDATADRITPPPSSTDNALTPPAPLDQDPKLALPNAPQTDALGNGFLASASDAQPVAGAPTPAPTSTAAPVATLPPAAPTAAAGSEYIVQKGDSLSLIARRTLGKESRWTEIAELNPGLTPKNLKVGSKLAMPGDAAPVASQPEKAAPKKSSVAPKPKSERAAPPEKLLAGGRSCKVQKGDTLQAIARRELGDGERWKEIAELNPGVSPSKLSVGQVLRMPAGARALEHSALVADAAPVSSKPRIR